MLKNGLTYKKREFAKVLTFPQYEERREEQMYCALTLFRPHKRDDFKNWNYQEVHHTSKCPDGHQVQEKEDNDVL